MIIFGPSLRNESPVKLTERNCLDTLKPTIIIIAIALLKILPRASLISSLWVTPILKFPRKMSLWRYFFDWKTQVT